MPEEFDPYAEWLEIGVGQRPPTNYQLLGVAAFEAKTAAIEAAAAARKAKVQPHSKGPHGAMARRILAELAMAEGCLLDPKTKAVYDEHMGHRGAADDDPYSLVPENKASETSRPKFSPVVVGEIGIEKLADLSASKIDTVADFYQENLPSRPALRELPPKQMLAHAASATAVRRWLLGGTAAVIGLGSLFGLVYFLIIAASPVDPAPAAARPAPAANFDDNPSVAPRGGPIVQYVPRPPLPSPQANVASVAPSPTAPVQANLPAADAVLHPPGWPWIPLPAVAPPGNLPAGNVAPRFAKAGNPPLAGVDPLAFPHSFSLPAADSAKPVLIGVLPIKSDSIVAVDIVEPGGDDAKRVKKFLIQPDVLEGDMSRWSLLATVKSKIASTQTVNGRVAVGKLSLDHDRLSFQWLPEAREAELASLRNCLLRATVDGHRFCASPRAAHHAEPLKLDLDKEVTSFELADDDVPDANQLKFVITAIKGVDRVPATFIGATLTGLSDELRLMVREADPVVELRLHLSRSSGKIILQAAPVILSKGNSTIPLSNERIATLNRALPRELAEAEARLNGLSSQMAALELQVKNLIAAPANVATQVQKKLLLEGYEADRKRIVGHANVLSGQIQSMQAKLKVLPELERLVSDLAAVKMNVQLAFPLGGDAVEIMRAD